MEEACGELQFVTPRILSWTIGCKNSSNRWMSNGFAIQDYLNTACFIIQPDKKESKYAVLRLCETNDGAPKTYNLSILLEYNFGERTVSGIYTRTFQCGKWCMYDLEIVNANLLDKVTCTFVETDSSKSTSESTSESTNSRVESCKKRKYEEDRSVIEQNKIINLKGLNALSADLKEAFFSEEDTDITIKVGDQQYRAHKVILRSRSPVFHSMLKHDMVEKIQGSINISDCDPLIFRDFLLYLYTGKLGDIKKENVFELYQMSDKYNVDELKMDCVSYIIDNIDKDIICDVIVLAIQHFEKKVLEHATTFFVNNAETIFRTSNWQNFLKNYPIQANELIIKAFDSNTKKVELINLD